MSLVLKWQGYRKFCANCILKIHGILDIPQALNILRFCMDQKFYYARVSQDILKGLLMNQSSESILETTLKLLNSNIQRKK